MKGLIRNVVIGCPGETWEEYLEEGRVLASFYAELLGMRIIREDWFKIAKDEDSAPQLAFGEGPGAYRPPRWPDPDYPQQLHLDIFVRDVDDAGELVTGSGATLLQDKEDFRSYADPHGHPFCLYPDPDPPDDGSHRRLARVVFDCFSPRALATFYEELLDMRTRVEDSAERVVIASDDATAPMLAFQHAVYTPPRWPDPNYPSQLHLDLYFDDGAAARERAESLGAIPLPAMGGSCPVYADPASHPFCLCTPGQ